MVAAGAAIYLQARSFTLTVYIMGVLSVMVLMALLYYLIFLKLYKRAEVARQRSRSLITAGVAEKKKRSSKKNVNKSVTSEVSNNEINSTNDKDLGDGNKNGSILVKSSKTIIKNNNNNNNNNSNNKDNNNKDNQESNIKNQGSQNGNLLTVDFASKRSKESEKQAPGETRQKLAQSNATSIGIADDEISRIDGPDEKKAAASKLTNPLLKKPAQQVSQMEQMMKRSAKIFLIITAFYILCFMPNAILTILYLIIGPSFIFSEKPVIIEYIIKYINLFYNLNFILMPTVYAVLNRQFWEDCALLKKKILKCFGRDSTPNSAGSTRPRVLSVSQCRNPAAGGPSRTQLNTNRHHLSVITAVE